MPRKTNAPPRVVRIRDVAEAAAVSTATVSRALASPERVGEETRRRVFAAVAALNYTPNEAARALRAGATRMVLVEVPHLYSGAFFAAVVNGVDAVLAAAGYTMLMGSFDGNEDRARRLMDLVYARQFDGVISLPGRTHTVDRRSILDSGAPLVSICAVLPGRRSPPAVILDDEECAIAQTRHLFDLGHRRLLHVAGLAGHYNAVIRHRGFLKAFEAAGAPARDALYFQGAYTLQSGAEAGRYFLAIDPARRPTGVVCASDEMAIGFIKTVTAAGVRTPRDVSVVGFDGIAFADYCEPSLTTIRQPCHELGGAGARTLLALLGGASRAPAKPIVLRGELIVRDS
ncbi:MAG: LacI family DNA-binding transcriptional regulator, partial [Pseudomonadota bacterium]|nr:LacI family DNA-binding transcriptional regulator [Pseudomonadota bacterium]